MVLNALGLVTERQGDSARAKEMITESLLLRRDLGDRQGLAEGLETMAGLLAAADPPEAGAAARLLGAAHGLRETIGAPIPAIERQEQADLVERVRGLFEAVEMGNRTPGEIAFADAWNTGEALAAHPPEKLIEQALAGWNMAQPHG
jgi:hypothetical protein